MTLLAAWVGIDSRKISSLYIASDSLFSWGGAIRYDQGRKVFSCTNEPVVLGYCGDVLFPSFVLGQVIQAIDRGLLFRADSSNVERLDSIVDQIQRCLLKYPTDSVALTGGSVEFLIATRTGNFDFHCARLRLTGKQEARVVEIDTYMPHSYTLAVLGSGATSFRHKFDAYQRSNDMRTSRAVYQSLCHTLDDAVDGFCGGAPQIVGLYNTGPAINIGVVHKGRRFLNGMEVPENPSVIFDGVEWRNELFERCNPQSLKILDGAQRQPNPLKY